MQDRGGVLELTVLADRRRLAVALRPGAIDPKRCDRLLRKQLAELLADRDQGRQVLDIAAGKRIFDHRQSPRRAGSAAISSVPSRDGFPPPR